METHQVCEGKPANELLQSDCIKCNSNTNHKILSYWVYEEYFDDDIQANTDFQIIQCQGCDSFSFRSISSCSEDYWTDPETGKDEYYYSIELYPNRAVGKLRIRPADLYLLPSIVREALNETHDAICMKNNILSVAGIRITLEAVCQEQKCKGTLEKKIDTLVKKDFITQTNANILHKLRLLGNESVHEMKVHRKEEINIAFTIAQNLLESVYIIPKKAEGIKSEQQKKKLSQ